MSHCGSSPSGVPHSPRLAEPIHGMLVKPTVLLGGLGARFVLSFGGQCPSHSLFVSPCPSLLSSPESPALRRAVTCGLVLSGQDSARVLPACLSFPQGVASEQGTAGLRGSQVPPSVLVASAVGRRHSHVAFKSPSILTDPRELPQRQPHTKNVLAPGPAHGKVNKQPAVVSGRFACEPLAAFGPREGLSGALFALERSES